jgi:hypothetical protein
MADQLRGIALITKGQLLEIIVNTMIDESQHMKDWGVTPVFTNGWWVESETIRHVIIDWKRWQIVEFLMKMYYVVPLSTNIRHS